MPRIRMTWDWVEGYPVYVYTKFLDHNVFKVTIVLGKYGNQNAGYNGPHAEPYFEYISRGIASVAGVGVRARRIAKKLIQREKVK